MKRILGSLAVFFTLTISIPTCQAIPSDPKEMDRVESSSNSTYEQLNLFGEIFERVRHSYVDKPDDQKLVESALNGMLTSLDPHSGYLDSKSFAEMRAQTKGEFGGLGIEITMENGLVKIVSPIDDTPAFKAGLQPNDFIVAIGKTPVVGMTLNEAVEKMRGAPGTKVTLMIRRGETGEPFKVTLTRAVIRIRSVRSRLEKEIGYIRITTFNEQTETALEKAIKDIQKQAGVKLIGYVIDLRNNPGGLLDQAITVADTFLEKGEIVSTRGRKPQTDPTAMNRDQHYTAQPGDLTEGKPLVVLINGGSASAAEIVAGALQDNKRAILMGLQSFGKGSVQTVIPIPPHGAIRLTTARYYTPSGRSIQALGITPDIEVPAARVEQIDQSSRLRESDLAGALPNDNKEDNNKAQKKEKNGETEKKPPLILDEKNTAADYQLTRALDLLRGISLYKSRS